MQGEIENTLGVVLRSAPPLTAAGRTDAGVHAWGQVASYEGDPVQPSAINGLLPDDVAVLACEAAPPGFDARREATSRAYCYRVLARGARPTLTRGHLLHVPLPLDREALHACAAAVVGTKDFTAFTPTDTYHVRFERDVYSAEWRELPGDVLEFWIEADTFMRQMNRVLVGTMLEVAQGRRSVEEFHDLMAGQPRSAAGATAPAHGLYLAGVGYRGERVLAQEGGVGPEGGLA